eukprot:2072008-Rhodomonas_salina.1
MELKECRARPRIRVFDHLTVQSSMRCFCSRSRWNSFEIDSSLRDRNLPVSRKKSRGIPRYRCPVGPGYAHGYALSHPCALPKY